MRTPPVIGTVVLVCAAAAIGAEAPSPQGGAPAPVDFSLSRFEASRRAGQVELERAILNAVDPKRLSAWHDLVASEPHVAGTPGDLRLIESLGRTFEAMGLEVHTHWVWPYLCKPVSAELAIVAPASAAKTLGLTEPAIAEDPATRHPDLIPLAWNAYSGSGDVTAPVVYANYGTREDFDKLRALGVETKGAIAIARYGGNFRGYKARFAEEAGCAGLIIFTDPGDSGYAKGPSYPEGGWSTPTQVQCGSVLTTAWAGDPLTPLREATEHAERIDPKDAGLPKIPIQPVSWEAAQAIFKAMTGEPVAERVANWQGGLPLPYRLTSGPELRVRLKIEQRREITKTANVIATLRGAEEPEKKIIIGCHHDAWNHGACDPTCGLILVLEAAKVFSDLAKAGKRPDRSIVFCAWGAEEYGILGSVEWVEANLKDLEENGVAYINLDMATMGPNFSASSGPSLKSLIYDAVRLVPNAPLGSASRRRAPTAAELASPGSVFETWLKRSVKPGADSPLEPPIGDLGGGSDHIGFVCHALVPSISLGSGGAPGTSYHSNYDTLAWYRAVVGDDYLPAQMNTRVTSIIASRLANADVLPLDPRRWGPDVSRHLKRLKQRADAAGLNFDPAPIEAGVERLAGRAAWLESAPAEALRASREANKALRDFDRVWKIEEGLPGRFWFRNAYASSDRDSGYAPWILPIIEQAIADKDQQALDRAAAWYAEMLQRVTEN